MAVPRLLVRGLHLAVLSAFALAQPLFDLLARSPEFFVVRGSTDWDILAFAFALTLVPPGLLLALEALVGLVSDRAARVLHLVLVGTLAALVVLPPLARFGSLPSLVVLAVAAALAVAAVYAYARVAPIRAFLTVLAPAPLLFLGLFLLNSPTGKLLTAEEAHAAPLEAERRPPVVMIVFDEFPTTSLMNERGEIDAVRYPNFARFAREATWFRNTTTVNANTTRAVPAILTGRYPREDSAPIYAEHPESLFTLLGDGYRLDVVEAVTLLCPEELCPRAAAEPFRERMRALASDLGVVYLHVLAPEDVRARLPSISGMWSDFRGRRERARAPRGGLGKGYLLRRLLPGSVKYREASYDLFVDSLGTSRGPTLSYLHVLLPHYPWEYVPSGTRYPHAFSIAGLVDDYWGGDDFLVQQGWQRHLLQVGHLDRLVGDLTARLRATGLYDRALVVLVADHGVSFRVNGPRKALTEENLEDLLYVPLFVKEPGQREGRVVDAHVETVDVLPTIADALDLRVPWRLDGKSALTGEPREPRVHVTLTSGKEMVFDANALLDERDRLLELQGALFGSGNDGPGLFGIGPHPELLAEPTSELRIVSSDLRAELDQRELVENVRPASGVVPVRLTGRIRGGEAGDTRALAITVNGLVVAVAQTYRFRDEETFSVLVPDDAYRPGRNDVELLAVSERAGPFSLERLHR